jgi:hypothetical protein
LNLNGLQKHFQSAVMIELKHIKSKHQKWGLSAVDGAFCGGSAIATIAQFGERWRSGNFTGQVTGAIIGVRFILHQKERLPAASWKHGLF